MPAGRMGGPKVLVFHMRISVADAAGDSEKVVYVITSLLKVHLEPKPTQLEPIFMNENAYRHCLCGKSAFR